MIKVAGMYLFKIEAALRQLRLPLPMQTAGINPFKIALLKSRRYRKHQLLQPTIRGAHLPPEPHHLCRAHRQVLAPAPHLKHRKLQLPAA